jgi:hypothetical protein
MSTKTCIVILCDQIFRIDEDKWRFILYTMLINLMTMAIILAIINIGVGKMEKTKVEINVINFRDTKKEIHKILVFGMISFCLFNYTRGL